MSTDTEYDLRKMRQARAEAERKQAVEAEAKELAEQISRFVNDISGGREKAKALGRAMLNDHRTLLQTKTLIALEYLDGLAGDLVAGHYDARNEATCKIAAKMMGALDTEDKEFIPFI